MGPFLDTNHLTRLYLREPGSLQVAALVERLGPPCIAEVARAEFASVLLRKRRERQLTADQARLIQAQFLDDIRSGWVEVMPVTASTHALVEKVAATVYPNTYLRALDAIHLACAAEHGATVIWSADKHLLAAAPAFGLEGWNAFAPEAGPGN